MLQLVKLEGGHFLGDARKGFNSDILLHFVGKNLKERERKYCCRLLATRVEEVVDAGAGG